MPDPGQTFGLELGPPGQATVSRTPLVRRDAGLAADDGRACRATSPPDLTTPSGPAFTNRPIPTARSIYAAISLRYPTNIPAALRSSRPTTPGDANAASASMDSGAKTASTVCCRTERTRSGIIPPASTALIPTGRCSTAPLAPTPSGVGCAAARADASAAESPGAMSIPGQPVGTDSDDASCIRAAVYRPPAKRLPPIPPAVSDAVAASAIAGMPRRERRLFGILMYGTPSGVSAMKKYASALMTSLAAATPTTGGAAGAGGGEAGDSTDSTAFVTG